MYFICLPIQKRAALPFFFLSVFHKNHSFAHNTTMALVCVAICIEILLIAFFMPIRFSATAHFSLSNDIVKAQIKLANISLVRVKVCLRDGLQVQINGKEIKTVKGSISVDVARKIAVFAIGNNIFKAKELIAYVGARDAKNAAILAAILQISSIFSKTLVRECQNERFDAECEIKIKVNAAQALKAIAISKGR